MTCPGVLQTRKTRQNMLSQIIQHGRRGVPIAGFSEDLLRESYAAEQESKKPPLLEKLLAVAATAAICPDVKLLINNAGTKLA
jgi:hypothetical protein